MYLTHRPFPVRRQWFKLLLAVCALAGVMQVQGMGKIFKTTNPEQFFDGRMLEMAQAIQSNDMARLRQLAVGQNLNQPGRQDMSLLWFAMQPDQLNTEAVKTLVSLGADPAANPIKDFGSPLDYVFMSRKSPGDTTGLKLLQAMLDGGLKKKDRQNKALVDEISATIILQSYLESKKYIK